MFILLVAPIACFAYRKKPRARVISLHDIPERWRNDFEEKMKWLKANCNTVSLESIYNRVGLDNNRLNVALTFDDGFKEHATFAAAVLRTLSIPATFFIPSAAIGATDKFGRENLKRRDIFKFMDVSDVKSLANDSLFQIGGHTMHHTNLGQQLSSVELEKEIVQDKYELEKIIGKSVDFFAYPFGSVKDLHTDSILYIKSAGYKAAFTIVPSFWLPDRNHYHVGRDSLSFGDSIELWSACLHGGYDAISQFKNLLFP